MKTILRRWPITIINLVFFIVFVPYLFNIVKNNHYSEGYEIALTCLIVEVFCLPVLVFYLIKKKRKEALALGIMMLCFFLFSLLGVKLSIYLICTGAISFIAQNLSSK